MPTALTRQQAEAFAEELDVSLDDNICYACLSFVSIALDRGDERGVARELSRMTPDLWDDGLAETALAAAQRAHAAGAPHAVEALADLRGRGGRSLVARALVRRLAAQLSERVRAENEQLQRVRARYGGEHPELN